MLPASFAAILVACVRYLKYGTISLIEKVELKKNPRSVARNSKTKVVRHIICFYPLRIEN